MANKFQPVDYRDVEDLLSQLPSEELLLVNYLRNLILETLPQVKEKLAYNVPFYYLKKRIAFIWPASVPWGKLREGVALGFTQGYLFSDQSVFPSTDHKVIRQFIFNSPEDVDPYLIKALILEAVEIDNSL